MGGLPEGLAVWLRGLEKSKSLQEEAEMADDNVTTRKAEGREVLYPRGPLIKDSQSLL